MIRAVITGSGSALPRNCVTNADLEARVERLIRQDFATTDSNYFRTIFATSLAKLDLLTAFPQADDQSLLTSLPPLRHLAPVRQVQSLADRGDRQLNEVVDRFSHHYRLGLDICFPRWDEDREFVIQLLRDLPSASAVDTRERYTSALARVRAQVPRWRHAALQRRLER